MRIKKSSGQNEPVDLSIKDPLVLHKVFERAAARTPKQIAIIDGNEKISYEKLDKWSSQLAHFLIKTHHVNSGDFVVVSYERGVHFVVSVLAILKCGAAYVPIDTAEALERKIFILDDINPTVSLVQSTFWENYKYPNLFSIASITNLSEYSQLCPKKSTKSSDLACVFYTGGSTGNPKGVLLEHQAISSLIKNPRYLSLTKNDKVLFAGSIAFDVSSFEIWAALLNSATLVCVDYPTLLNSAALGELLINEEVSMAVITSALFDQLVNANHAVFKNLKYLLVIGDVLNPKSVQTVFNNPSGRPVRVINTYGPTEAGILTCSYVIQPADVHLKSIPIGKALSDTYLYVLDEELKPVPCGQQGELYIGGYRLARGYSNLEEKTKASFITNPFTGNPQDRLYKTGDLVRCLEDGNLDFIGRCDRQVKFRGFRMELDAIEYVMCTYGSVAIAAVQVYKRYGDDILVAYIQAHKKEKIDVEQYKSYLLEKLAGYMVPSIILQLDNMPLTVRGKLDRSKLPALDLNEIAESKGIVEPKTKTEEKLHDIWRRFFDMEKISTQADFFEIGGSSILLAGLYAEIRKHFEVPFTISGFIRHPTIEKLGQFFDTGEEDFEELALIAQDAVLKENIQPRYDENLMKKTGDILLTGVTGFLGSHLLFELLRTTTADIYCLVRRKDSQTMDEQLKKALNLYRLDLQKKDNRRIKLIEGDFTMPNLGLPPEDYEILESKIQTIYHCGAYVHHIYTYEQLKVANVFSVEALINLAFSVRKKTLNFISSINSISQCDASGLGLETIISHELDKDIGGYALTKWVGERLMEEAFSRGLKGSILRLGNIYAHSASGITNPPETNFSLLLLKSYIESGYAPDCFPYFEGVSVDAVAKAVVAIGQDEQEDQTILNLCNSKIISYSDYIDIINRVAGVDVRIIPFDEWKKRVVDPLTKESDLYSLSLFFHEKPEAPLKGYRTEYAQIALQKHEIIYPKNYESLITEAFKYGLLKSLNIGV